MGMISLSWIGINWLYEFIFCEYQAFLRHVQMLDAVSSEEMRLGTEIHEQLLLDHQQQASASLSICEALKIAQETKKTLVAREVRIKSPPLIGVIDELEIRGDKLVIIDDKPSEKAYLSAKMQVFGYCKAFVEMYQPKIPVYACIRSHSSKHILWNQLFTEKENKKVSKVINRLQRIIAMEEAPNPCSNVKKCQACRFTEKCDKKALK